MLLLQFTVKPKHQSKHFGKIGGGFVNCYVQGHDQDAARQKCRAEIETEHFEVISLDNLQAVTRNDFPIGEDSVALYDGAQAYGRALVFHTWPVDAPDADEPT